MSSKDKIALFPGSFDPITNGHIDVINRAIKMFDKLIICVAKNNQKKSLLSIKERIHIIKETFGDNKSIRIDHFDNLLVDYAKKNNAQIIIRGLRAISDFEYEFQMALMNRKISKNLETTFLMPSEEYTYLSSSMVKEICRLGGNIIPFVPCAAEKILKKKYNV